MKSTIQIAIELADICIALARMLRAERDIGKTILVKLADDKAMKLQLPGGIFDKVLGRYGTQDVDEIIAENKRAGESAKEGG